MIHESLRVALSTLRANPLRTLLSTLGVVIGVASLVAILALADGMEAFMRTEIGRTTDLQVVTVAPITTDRVGDVTLRREHFVVFTPEDERVLAQLLAGEAEVGLAVLYASFWRAVGADSSRQLVVYAATPSYLALMGARVTAGRLLTRDDVDSRARVAVVSSGLARSVAADAADAVGREILIGDERYDIVGVALSEDTAAEQVGSAAVPYMPPAQLPGLLDARPPSLTIRAHDVERVTAVRERIETWLAGRWGGIDERFAVASNVDRVEQAEQSMLIFKLIMSAITGISLLVGGIGIMNILLASISERTREIGIRRATGARKRDIRRQFLAESVAIAAIGSGLGLVLGLTGSLVIMTVVRRMAEAPIRAVFAWESMLLAVVAALVVGIAFGMYPARRASKLSPIEALRHE